MIDSDEADGFNTIRLYFAEPHCGGVDMSRSKSLLEMHPLEAQHLLCNAFCVDATDERFAPTLLLYLWQSNPVQAEQRNLIDSALGEFQSVIYSVARLRPVCILTERTDNGQRDLVFGMMFDAAPCKLLEVISSEFFDLMPSSLSLLDEGGGYCGSMGQTPYSAYCQLHVAREGEFLSEPELELAGFRNKHSSSYSCRPYAFSIREFEGAEATKEIEASTSIDDYLRK